MATQHGILSVRLRDNLGVVGSHRIYVQIDDTKTLAQLKSDAAIYTALLDPVTDAAGVGARLEIDLPATGMKTSVSVDDPLGNGGLFTFNQAVINRKNSIVIPSFAEAQIAGSKISIGGSTPAQLWIDWIVSNTTAFTVESAGQHLLNTFLSVRLNDRKYRKSETRVTTETP